MMRSVVCFCCLALMLLSTTAATTVTVLPGSNGEVKALTVFDGELIAGGAFTIIGGVEAAGVAAWNGSSWRALGDGLTGEQTYWDHLDQTIIFPPCVDALAVFGGQLIAGGTFTTGDGAVTGCIARWNGVEWRPLGTGITSSWVWIDRPGSFYVFPPRVHTLTATADSLIVGGLFGKAGDISTRHIASWNGSVWADIKRGVGDANPARVLATASQWQDNSLVIGGHFSVADNTTVGNLATWTGETWSSPGNCRFNRDVLSLLVDGDDLYAGGTFTSVADTTETLHIARLREGQWQSLGDGLPNEVRALTTIETHIFAGAFRWTGSEWVNEIRTNGPINALTVYDGQLVAGGDFGSADNVLADNICAWTSLSPVQEPPPPLQQLTAWPNPFNPQTTISGTLSASGPASLSIHDFRGRRVRDLASETRSAGVWNVIWNGRDNSGRDLPSGIYLARLRCDTTTATVKLTILR